jgi:hypothetical protein
VTVATLTGDMVFASETVPLLVADVAYALAFYVGTDRFHLLDRVAGLDVPPTSNTIHHGRSGRRRNSYREHGGLLH